MKISKPSSFSAVAPKQRCGRPPGPFLRAVTDLAVGQAITVDFEAPKKTGRVYPVVSRIAKKTGRKFQCRRINDQQFTIYRIS
jgi:hypothetical protein